MINDAVPAEARERGFFLAGKFDQLTQEIPYATIVQAFRGLVQQILAQSDGEIAAWKACLQQALALNGQLIIDVIPQIELIIGAQPPVVELPASEARSRFNLVCRQFLGVFTTREHPLTLFLDDLQWVDAASLELLQHLLTYPDTRYLYLMGTYRDSEVGPEHPLRHVLREMRRAGARVQTLVLPPLSRQELDEFIADTLQCDLPRIAPLAQLVYDKTGGNPFFFIQFFLTLHQDGLLLFNRRQARWEWDVEGVRARGYTHNVVDFMVDKLKRLPEATQQALQRIACLSNQVDRPTLAIILAQPIGKADQLLNAALEEGLLRRTGEVYHFSHDRIRQAAYSLAPPAERPGVHVSIGRRLLESIPSAQREQRLFAIVGQFNLGADAITARDEQVQVATLNLYAGQRAKASTAHQAAIRFFSAGLTLLADTPWEARYALLFALTFGKAECAYLTGNFADTEQMLALLCAHTHRRVDLAAVYRLMVDYYTIRDDVPQAFTSGIACLKLFGIELSPRPTREQVLEEYHKVEVQLGNRPVEALLDLPPMTDREMLAALNILVALLPTALFSDNYLLGMISGLAVNISLRYGNTDASAIAYALFGSVLCGLFHEYQLGYRYGKVGYDLVQKAGVTSYKAQATFVFGDLVNFWTHPLTTNLEYLHEASQAALASGEIGYACYCANHIVTVQIVTGVKLDEVYRESEIRLDFVRKAHYEAVVDEITSMQRLIQNLRGRTTSLSTFNDADFDQEQFEDSIRDRRTLTVCWYYILKLQARCMFGDYQEALAAGQRAHALLWSTISHVQVPEFSFYYALTLASVYEGATPAQQPEYLGAMQTCLDQYQQWAEHSPANYRNREALLRAEMARITGQEDEAQQEYETAIRLARADGFVQHEALANELAARFARARGDVTTAEAYLRDAHYSYARWGAEGKVRQLEAQMPSLRTHTLAPPFAGTVATSVEHLDLLAVVKASQAISGELQLSKLAETLLRIVIEQAGAQRGDLLLMRGNSLTVVAEAEVEHGKVDVTLTERTMHEVQIPLSIINYIMRTRENVLLDNAMAPNPFSMDGYLVQHQPKSILCFPIVRQAALVGILYLENNLISGAFTPERLAVLELLAAQSAISLANAQFYVDLQQEITVRRMAEEEIRQLNAELDQRVQDRTTQLEAANNEMEAFTYSVSHDLRAPLRAIDGFSHALLEDYTDRLDAHGIEDLRYIRKGAQQMARLIDDLLRLSQVGRVEMHCEPVALSALAREVADSLQQQQPDRQVEWVITPNLNTVGDPSLLRIKLENLLGNAWKFTGNCAIARIELLATAQQGETVYAIRDNGAGFDMAYAEKLFTPFQRLHSADEFPGTGIGLTIVQRIIHRHGGRIWPESAEGEGTTFYFTLPGAKE